MNTHLNQFTNEFWRGSEDRHTAPDYVTRELMASFHAPLIYHGRINGKTCEDQDKLKLLRAEMLESVFAKGAVLKRAGWEK